MADPARRHATYDDLRAVPRHLVAEIIGGTLRTHPRPAPRHAHASSRLGARLSRYFDEGDGGPGGWWILDEPELHFTSGDIVVPDIAGWRVERMPELPATALPPIGGLGLRSTGLPDPPALAAFRQRLRAAAKA